MTDEARILISIPLDGRAGTRTVAVAADGTLHVLRAEAGDLAVPEQSFRPDGAVALARAVMAGSEQAMTAPATLRILAAALLVQEAGH